jgi:hypothetical protein
MASLASLERAVSCMASLRAALALALGVEDDSLALESVVAVVPFAPFLVLLVPFFPMLSRRDGRMQCCRVGA